MDEARNVGVTVAFLRKLRGWSQKELAEAAGVHQSLISLYERGLEAPTRKTLERLADAVGVPFALVEQHLAFVRRARASLGQEPLACPDASSLDAVVDSVLQAVSRAVHEIVRPVAAELLEGIGNGKSSRE